MYESVAIVAIPEQDDYVWKLSSEKVPHMTLLYLGDLSQNPNLQHIVEFTAHVVSTTMKSFHMSVARRGTLGPNDADVLFFEERYTDAIQDMRNSLLQDPIIRAAYDSTEQFPTFTPHLTMGYPDRPAAEDTRDYPGIHGVNFDVVSVWIGDSEGPEFLLGDQYENVPLLHGEDFLAHYGVKGMRWGQHRRDQQNAKVARGEGSAYDKFQVVMRATNLDIAKGGLSAKGIAQVKIDKADGKWEKSIYKRSGAIKTHNNVARQMNGSKGKPGVLDKLNNDPKYKGKDLYDDKKLHKQYMDEYTKLATTAYNKAIQEEHGASPSGTRTAVYKPGDGKDIPDRIVIQNSDGSFRHAEEDDVEDDIILLLNTDDKGYVLSTNEAESVVEHTIDDLDSFLAHYGVKGMKWGKRISDSSAARASSEVTLRTTPKNKIKTVGGKGRDISDDARKTAVTKQVAKKSSTNALSNKELQEMVTRMNLEQQYARLQNSDPNSNRGQKFVAKLLGKEGDKNTRMNSSDAAVADAIKTAMEKKAAG